MVLVAACERKPGRSRIGTPVLAALLVETSCQLVCERPIDAHHHAPAGSADVLAH